MIIIVYTLSGNIRLDFSSPEIREGSYGEDYNKVIVCSSYSEESVRFDKNDLIKIEIIPD